MMGTVRPVHAKPSQDGGCVAKELTTGELMLGKIPNLPERRQTALPPR